MSTAPVPATIIEKGILADSLVVDTIIKKYRDHNPLYRQSVGVKRDANVEISQSTLSSCTLKAGELLLSVVAAMKAELLAGAYIQADVSNSAGGCSGKRLRSGQSGVGINRSGESGRGVGGFQGWYGGVCLERTSACPQDCCSLFRSGRCSSLGVYVLEWVFS